MNKSGGLGRGLGALIPRKHTDEVADTISELRVQEISVDQIHPNPRQPREHFAEESLEELSRSIAEHGIMQPLIVLRMGNGYELVAGERRLRASKKIGLKTVPAIVRTATDQQKLELALLENIQREDLNPIEEARAYRALSEEFGMSHDEIAKRVGKSRPVVSNMMRLLELPDEMQQALAKGTVSYAAARALLGVASPEERWALFRRLAGGERISSAEIERRAPTVRRVEDPNLKAVEQRLREALGTKVKIKQRGGRGTITIEFYSDEELGGLVDRMGK
ncbi:MAG: ParB/RepB/Spo0J family partition protein [bacterium]|nr:ParB/RepB/Spo0J family partition protein [bacterium]